jgi:hypothetical protein
MKQSLYIRAAGATTPATRRLMFLLQLFVLAERADQHYKGVIARCPQELEGEGFRPNFAALADQVQTLGFQRAVSVAPVENIQDAQNEQDAVEAVQAALRDVPAERHSADVLSVFQLRANDKPEALFGPWKMCLQKTSVTGLKAAKENAASVVQPITTFQTWSKLAKSPADFQKYLKAYFSARVFPTAPQMLGSYAILTNLLKSPQNNLMGGFLWDGQLTELEHKDTLREHDLWQGTPHDLGI